MAVLRIDDPDLIERAAALGITISPSTPTLGAEIAGIDLDRLLDPPVAAIVREA
ncbi:hypothetical protein [Sphingomonas colocasiae]|uniref:hypothetical protein n=1 Tax=Sphingomonas colocasiae TaxID=1848973 RepID=UPI001FE74B03|nr:hypothetical protein [Sphingomonas colocasiae]